MPRINASADYFISPTGALVGADPTLDNTTALLAGPLPGLPGAVYNAARDTRSDGDIGVLETDSTGQLLVVASAGTNLNTSALALESGGNLAALVTDAAAMEALLTTIDTDTSTLAGAVSGTEVQVDVVTTVEAPPKITAFPTGTVASSGDNTVMDISALAGYSSGDRIVITAIRIQNESSTSTTVVIKNGATSIARVLCETKGSGVDRQYPVGRELRLSANADLVLNLSGANSIGHSIEYFLETF